MSTNLKLSEAQISKIFQSGGFLGSLLSKLAVPLMKVAVAFAKKYFSSARNYSSCFSDWCRNSKKNTWFWDNNFNHFKWKNEWHNENCSSSWRSNILLKGVTKAVKNETREQRGGFLETLVGTLGSILLRDLLSGKGIVRAGSGKGIVRTGSGKQLDF